MQTDQEEQTLMEIVDMEGGREGGRERGREGERKRGREEGRKRNLSI